MTRRFWKRILATGFIAAVCLGAQAAWAQGPDQSEDPGEAPARPYLKTLYEFLLPADRSAVIRADADTRGALEETARRADVDAPTRETLEAMAAFLDAERLPFTRQDLIGDWSFRSYQLDPLGAYTYSFFPGRIYPEGLALILDKSGGSQKHFGMMAMQGEAAMLYVGAESYSYDARPRLYSTMEADPDAEARERDESGMLYRIEPERFILVFTEDGGRYEILELVPR